MVDKNIIEYRIDHPKCEWCKYCKYNYKEIGCQPFSWNECILKDKILSDYKFINKIEAKLCKYYEIKGDSKE